jgi:hypothetical protein
LSKPKLIKSCRAEEEEEEVTLASTNNVLPEDGVTAPKHVGATLM